MNNDTHVYPLNDLQEHILEGVECPCNPTVKVIGADLLIIHNAFDNREIIEEAIAIMKPCAICGNPTEGGRVICLSCANTQIR